MMKQDGSGPERLNRDDLDFFKKDDDASKKDAASVIAGSVTDGGKGSP